MGTTGSRGSAMVLITTLAAILAATTPAAGGYDDFPGQTELEIREESAALDDVRAATGLYHDVDRATADGYAPWGSDALLIPTCIDAQSGGGGIRYLRGLDGRVDPLRPEVLVYELTPEGRSRLVAVEYMVPAMFLEDAPGNDVATPEVLGYRLRLDQTIPVYALRAWLWKDNPLGVFAEANPDLGHCTPV